MAIWRVNQDADGDIESITDESQWMTDDVVNIGFFGVVLGYPYIMIGVWAYNWFGKDAFVGIAAGIIALIIGMFWVHRGAWIGLILLYIITAMPFYNMIAEWFDKT